MSDQMTKAELEAAARDHRCPSCGTQANFACRRTVRGKWTYLAHSHAERIALAAAPEKR